MGADTYKLRLPSLKVVHSRKYADTHVTMTKAIIAPPY